MFEVFEAVREMKEAGLSNSEIAMEFLGAVLVFAVPIGMMFL